MRVLRLGECALFLSEDAPPSLAGQRRIWAFANHVRLWPDVVDVVPGLNNVTLSFRPDVDPGDFEHEATSAWNISVATDSVRGRLVEIPVRYGGEYGPDLGSVAQRTGLMQSEVVALHAGGSYVVYFLGFQPGFAYMGGLDARLHVARREHPRTAVPPGSVAIAGDQTAVYPRRSPGGWQIIGQTALNMFDFAREPAALLSAGDRVRFVMASP
ncbi:MAG: 5-oxoprolinase subunit PxpB [Candidatus Eremiobacteraeota bacterium]|nr:5-oxoprolinase subunit PxpB [Candidatus Eremiobacteraeota bacterium]